MTYIPDPTELQTAGSILATLLGAICSWKGEQTAKDQDKFQSFSIWLENHNFQALKERIFESEELQRNLNRLLQADLSEIDRKLATVCDAVAAISSHIEGLDSVACSMGCESDSLSPQACQILRWFLDANSERYVVLHHYSQEPSPYRIYAPRGGSIYPMESQFFESDMRSLQEYGFVRLVDYSDRDQNPIYSLTRTGAAFAAQLKKPSSCDEGEPPNQKNIG